MNRLAERGAELLGGVLQRAVPMGGGNLSEIMRIILTDGREAVVKNGPAPMTEAAMLRAIAATGAPAPEVLACTPDVLVIALLPGSSGIGRSSASLGAVLAGLHAAEGDRYGWSKDYAFGSLQIPNSWMQLWPAFWGERRLLPHLPHLPVALARRVEWLAADLPNRLPAQPRAALLHGDLWSGNILSDGARIAGLVDPACYYGHGEVDIAMLTLFGSPEDAFFDAYGPLEPGYCERLAIYQLWPALVHLSLFGGGYRSLVERLLSAIPA